MGSSILLLQKLMRITLIMTLTIFSATQLLVAENTYGQVLDKRVDLSYQKTDMYTIIKDIQAKTGIDFAFTDNLGLEKITLTDVQFKSQKLEKILSTLLTNKRITFEEKSGTITLYKLQQPGRIIGRVTDEQGQPLAGASIRVLELNRSYHTDNEGNYSFSTQPGTYTLEVSYISYGNQQKSVNVDEGTEVTIVFSLSEEEGALDEVVVVGYGTQKKVNLTGAVTQITSEDMTNRPISKMTQALQGVIPNLNITFGSGKPGESGTLNIRGTTSINGGSPLVLIDGVPGNMDHINVNDVESITVLKDASASAVYGARAAFGVILLTTKSGEDGKFQVNYQNNFGWTTHATNTDFNTSGYSTSKLRNDAFYAWRATEFTNYTDEDWDELYARVDDKTEHPDRPWVVVKELGGVEQYHYYGNFDWFNYFYDEYRPRQSHDLRISGSSGNTSYMISGNLANEQGIFNIRPDEEDRYNFRAKISSDVLDWLNISSNTRYFKSVYDWHGFNQFFTPSSDNGIGSSDPQFYTPYHQYYPTGVPFNPDGTITGATTVGTVGYGLHAILEDGRAKGRSADSEFATTFQSVFKLAEGLTVTGNYTYTQSMFQRYYRSVKLQFSKHPGVMEDWTREALNTDQLTERFSINEQHVVNAFANYDRQFGVHGIRAMAGYNQELLQYKNITASGLDLLSTTLNDLNLITGPTPRVGGGSHEYALRGAFARINYDYAGKYLFEASGRYDGTSRFPQTSRFGFFPSFSAGYRISEEAFFEPLKPIVDNLKIRYSFGTLGNQDVSNYIYVPTMSASNSNWLQNGERMKITNTPAPVASSLTWETATTNNVGVDINLLKNRFSVVADFYTRDTKNMLTQGMALPSVFGASEPRENAADLRTQGVEVSLSWRDNVKVANKDFNYNITAIFADASAKITKFDNPAGLLNSYRVGQKFGEIWGYSFDGFFKTTEEAQAYVANVDMSPVAVRGNSIPELAGAQAGDIKILDLDGNGIINGGAGSVYDPGDRRIIGNSTPRYSYGLSMSASWNGIDVYALFQGIGQQHWYPGSSTGFFWGVYGAASLSFLPADFEDKIWTPENQDPYFPRLMGYLASGGEMTQTNDMYLQNLGYGKLRNLTIGYTLPASLTKKIKTDRVRLFVSGDNLLTWTKMDTDYIDPEEAMWHSDARTYPMGKTFSFGLELSF